MEDTPEVTLTEVELFRGGYSYYGRLTISSDRLVFAVARRRHITLELVANLIGILVAVTLWPRMSWWAAIGLGILAAGVASIPSHIVKRRALREAATGPEQSRHTFHRSDVTELILMAGGKVLIEERQRKTWQQIGTQLQPSARRRQELEEALRRYGWLTDEKE